MSAEKAVLMFCFIAFPASACLVFGIILTALSVMHGAFYGAILGVFGFVVGSVGLAVWAKFWSKS